MDVAQESVFSSGFILKLEDNQNNDNIVYRLKKNQVVHFLLGASLAYKDVTVYTDVPMKDEQCKQESNFRALQWSYPGKVGDKSSFLASVTFSKAGSFRYYFSYPGNEKAGCGYFLIEPTLKVGKCDEVLPIDSISMQTVLSKLLGSFDSWKQRLMISKESGYNALHFTPIQLLGESNSAYSIADQDELNPTFSQEGKPLEMNQLKDFIEELRQDWNMISLVDVVWNHTSKDSPWLKTHPQCSFNLVNSPHLRPAYLLDRALFYFSIKISKGDLARFPDGTINNETDVKVIRDLLLRTIIPPLALWEFFQCDVSAELEKFQQALESKNLPTKLESNDAKVQIVQDAEFKRLSCTIDIDVAINQFYYAFDNNFDAGFTALKSTLEWLNETKRNEIEDQIPGIVENILNNIRYERLDENGPKIGKVSKVHPIVPRYFLHNYPDTTVETDEESIMNDSSKAVYIMAHNGWVLNQNALENFAEYPSMTYFKRELVCWGDSVKLNYGKSADHCPYLWQRMRVYTEKMTTIFQGLRIDNCHSTPIHVAEYMLKAARAIRPDLYIFAELFTGSDKVDNLFVNRLGINSLVRECLNAWNCREQGRLIYLYGGEPIASFTKSSIPVLRESRAHAIMYDVTHDNECMIKKRSVYDVLPSSALVAISCCAIGSNRGHDEMVPHHINVVHENRLYGQWDSSNICGIVRIKKVLNQWHHKLAVQGFSQVFVDQRTEDAVAVTRHNPETHDSYVMVAYTSFDDEKRKNGALGALLVEGRVTRIGFEANPSNTDPTSQDLISAFSKNQGYINGLKNVSFELREDVDLSESKSIKAVYDEETRISTVDFSDFTPGSVVMFKLEPTSDIKSYIQKICEVDPDFDKIIEKMTLNTMNYVLFCCEEEQKTFNSSHRSFEINQWRPLVYAGLMGIALPMQQIKSENDLGHPICKNLRDGDWLLRYISGRLERYEDTSALGDWLDRKFRLLAKIPRFLIPTYFQRIIGDVTRRILNSCWGRMSQFVQDGGPFVRALSLASIALCSDVKDAQLPRVPQDKLKLKLDAMPSLAAGLPHFSSGAMRCWGRDTFISMRGLLMLTGRMNEARNIILSFAGCLRHGLIPNLLCEGKAPRYNCRDAVWFWLQSIQDYCTIEGNYDLLKAEVYRVFTTESGPPQLTVTGAKKQPLYDVIQEALQHHASGIDFRERDAGEKIDRNMKDGGFNVKISVDFATGIVSGGNNDNCGTWCDKMGESEKAGNRGVPATPRDGAAIEIVALCKSVTRWLHVVRKEGHFPYEGVKYLNLNGKTSRCTWKEWGDRIKKNFHKNFYVDETDQSTLVHKRGIYKDTLGATNQWSDYQLRPNFAVAMVFAPELFKTNEAWKALEIAEKSLLGPLGIKTLDPDDMQYRGDYDNSLDNEDASVSKGFNYHQGPEWLWPVGYFLRAKLIFAAKQSGKLKETIDFIQSYLVNVQQHLEKSDWLGLPELTNSNGQFCKDSCPIQAWSHSSFLDLMYDLTKAESLI